MKNKSIIIITVVLLLLALASCDSLIAPMKERLNPVDSENPVPAVMEFNANIGYDSVDLVRLVDLTWEDPIVDSNEYLEG